MTQNHSDDLFATDAPDPLVGQVIQGRYRIERKLGQGGMGAVYLAEHVVIKKLVAIKCLHAGLASNADVVRRFHNEAVAATAIGHPHIVDVTDMGRFDDGTTYMALEYLAGRDWQHDLDKTGPQTLERVAHIGCQICDALQAAAEKGIVHRDLKPENIFLIDRHGDHDFVKVLDFGISKFHDGIGGSTRTGELMGTPYYMAPEQVRGERDISHLADIYALGVIFFQVLTGRPPFDGNSLPELIMKIAHDAAPDLAHDLPDIPPEIAALVTRMLQKDQQHRPQSFREVAQVLSAFVVDSSRYSQYGSHKFGETVADGSHQVAPIGQPVPPRTRQPTPVAARGQDTSSGGTPFAYARPDDAKARTTLQSAVNGSRDELPADLPTNRNPKQGIVVIGAVGLAIAAGAWVFLSRPVPAPEPATAPAAEPTAIATTVRVQISTVPPDADLFLDGSPISNPFDGELSKDDKAHELVAKRADFVDSKRRVVLTSGQRIFIPLESKAGGPKATEPLPAPTGGARPQPRPEQRPQAQAAPAPSPAPAPAPSPAPAPPPTPKPQELKKIF